MIAGLEQLNRSQVEALVRQGRSKAHSQVVLAAQSWWLASLSMRARTR